MISTLLLTCFLCIAQNQVNLNLYDDVPKTATITGTGNVLSNVTPATMGLGTTTTVTTTTTVPVTGNKTIVRTETTTNVVGGGFEPARHPNNFRHTPIVLTRNATVAQNGAIIFYTR